MITWDKGVYKDAGLQTETEDDVPYCKKITE